MMILVSNSILIVNTGMRKGTPSMGKAPEKDDFGDFFSPSHQQAPDQYQDSTSSSVAKQNYSSLI